MITYTILGVPYYKYKFSFFHILRTRAIWAHSLSCQCHQLSVSERWHEKPSASLCTAGACEVKSSATPSELSQSETFDTL